MSWEIEFCVRPADPSDRAEHPDAHEVRMYNGHKPLRTVGVWKTYGTAATVAMVLNEVAKGQVR